LEKKLLKTVLVAVVATAIFLAATTTSTATGIVAGGGLVDAGDDSFRPAATAGMNAGRYFLNLSIWGRDFGKVSERNALATLGSSADVIGKLYVRYGLGALRDETSIDGVSKGGKTDETPATGDGSSSKYSEVSVAPLFLLGSGYRLIDAAAARLDLQWTSHIVPAGLGGIFLAHGRIQTLMITGGIDL
jgi:hypothetical protein